MRYLASFLIGCVFGATTVTVAYVYFDHLYGLPKN